MTPPHRPSTVLPEPPATRAERWAESDPDLVERLRSSIVADGPMTFARFMATVLYDPDRGYYATRGDRTSRSGDFLTAPELHPLFGATLATQVEETWQRLDRPDRFLLREEAAGNGALGLAILDRLVESGSPLADRIRYLPIEASTPREAEARDRLALAGHGSRLADEATRDDPTVGMVLANELLDALPVHRVTMRDGRLCERFVAWTDEWFADADQPPSTPELAASLHREGIRLVEGQVTEVGLAAATWLRELGARLERGLAMIIDYGHPAPARYDPALRPAGLLRTYRGHHVGDDPYRFVGRQDLTAHVDWTSLELAATDGGLDIIGRTTQAEALTGLGLGERLADLRSRPDLTAESYTAARASVVRLLDPRHLGGFSVLIVGRGLAHEPPLRSLAFRMPSRGD